MGGNVDVEAEPGEVGFDAIRLARIDTHLKRYVDDGRLAGWQVVLSRHGKRVHSSTYGLRDIEAWLPVEADTLWRIYSMTKPITSVAAMQLYERRPGVDGVRRRPLHPDAGRRAGRSTRSCCRRAPTRSAASCASSSTPA